MSSLSSVNLTKLSNGLTIVTDCIETVETISLGVWVNVGTRRETKDINGVSHLLEHMAFKGTKRRSARAIAEEIEAVGGHLNACTSREYTAYYAKILKEDIDLSLDIISDILQNSTIDAVELAREQEVVVQEINQAIDTPDDIIFDHFQSTAYSDQAIGLPVLGTVELVRCMSRNTLFDYMKNNYNTKSMILAVAGNLNHDLVVTLAEKYFTALPQNNFSTNAIAAYKGGEYRETRDLEQVHLVLGFNCMSYDDPDYYSASILSTLLGDGMSSRLFQEVREKRGLVYSIYSFISFYTDGGLFVIYAGTGKKEVIEVIPVICNEIIKVTQEITIDEVQRARAQLKASILMARESTGVRCEQLARQFQVYGRLIPVEEIVSKIEAIDVNAVVSVARRIFVGNPTFATIGQLDNVESIDSIKHRLEMI
ncbi:MAG: insulinase family protein [Rhodospirillaceae bacterium]|jgi:predicted Zn-dependent peptidase|nr:insulinase family protein [Rhodospirillaceae bacterium]